MWELTDTIKRESERKLLIIIHALTVKTYQERQENYIMYARMQLLISVYCHLIFINDLIYVLTNFAA